MCDEQRNKQKFFNDDEHRAEALRVSREFDELRDRYKDRMITKVMPNGVVVSTTNPERLQQYEEYCRRKTGHYRKPQ